MVVSSLRPPQTITPDDLGLEFRGGAAQLWHTDADEILLDGPAGTGKTVAALWRMHLWAKNYPGFRGLLVRKTHVALKGSALVSFRRFVLAHSPFGAKFYGGSNEEPPAYRYPNGSTLEVAGLFPDPVRVMSREYDAIFVNEATELQEDELELLTTRLRSGVLPRHQVLMDCNPGPPTHWLNLRAMPGGRTTRLYSRHEDNPRYFTPYGAMTEEGRNYIEGKLDRLTGVRYLRLRLGQWVAAEGQVYEQWDPSLHVIDGFAVDHFWPRYWVLDFGFTNPFVWQWWAEDPDGRLYRYREIYRTGQLVEDLALQGMALSAGEPRPVAVVADHDAEGRATFERYTGTETAAAYKAVNDGIQGVASRLKPQLDGRPRLFLLRDALVERDPDLEERHLPTCTEEEFPEYVWDTRQGRHKGDQPVKEHDHGMDATRYLVAHVDKIGVEDDRAYVGSYLGGRQTVERREP